MKTLFKILPVLLALVLLASCVTMVSGDSFEPIVATVDVEGASKNELYKRANMWTTEVITSAKSAMQYADKDEGILRFQFSIPYMHGWGEGSTMVKATIETKDEKARITLGTPYDFEIWVGYSRGYYNGTLPQKSKEQIDQTRNAMASSFVEYLKKPSNSW